MATYYNHAQIGIVDANGNVNVIYPKTVGADVSVDPSAHCAAGTTVQKVISNLGSAAFSSLSNSYNDSPSASDGYTQSVINSKITELNNKLINKDNFNFYKFRDGYMTDVNPAIIRSINIPANTYFSFSASLGYYESPPKEIRISIRNDSVASSQTLANSTGWNGNSQITTALSGYSKESSVIIDIHGSSVSKGWNAATINGFSISV